MPPFHIRPASVAAGDSKRLLANFDSQLPWLASVGSGAQWGSTSRSDQEHQVKYLDKVQRSERFMDQPLSQDWIRAYVAEVQISSADSTPEVQELASGYTNDGKLRIPVAGMVLDSKSAEYVRSLLPEQDEQHPFIYLSYLLSDRRTASINKGAGAALLDIAKDEAKELGVKRICADCWSGNERKLVKYYQSQGFEAIGEFGDAEKDEWPGSLLELRL